MVLDLDLDLASQRAQGHRDSTYAMLLQHPMPECVRALEQLVTTPRIGCWRDVRGFICYYEAHGDPTDAESAVALIAGCVRMTNAQLRLDSQRGGTKSWAAKWVPREPKCRTSPLLRWYYDALAGDMFPGAPDAQRRYRKLISELTPPQTEPLGLKHLVKRALKATHLNAAHLNAAFKQLKQLKVRHMLPVPVPVPVLSLAHSMGTGHNNCLHAGIGLALLLLPANGRMITFSSHAQWHEMQDPDDFVFNAQHLFAAARAPVNGLNANLESALNLLNGPGLEPGLEPGPALVISDMEHDSPATSNPSNPSNPINPKPLFWNVSYNGRAADFYGDHNLLHQIKLLQ
jgi:hypothetical protein